MATEKPKITATNETQQMGGAMTYSERYLLMSIYGIKDNNLDFDSQKPQQPTTKKPQQKAINRRLTASDVDEKWNGKIYKDKFIYINNEKIEVDEDQLLKLSEHSKYKSQ